MSKRTPDYFWLHQIATKYKNKSVTVLVFLSDTDKDGNEIVTIQSIVKGHYLIEQVSFKTREAACGFIENFTEGQANSFVNRTARSVIGFRRKKSE